MSSVFAFRYLPRARSVPGTGGLDIMVSSPSPTRCWWPSGVWSHTQTVELFEKTGCFHEKQGTTERKRSTGWEKLRKGLPEGVILELRGNNQNRQMVANAVPSIPTKDLGPPALLTVGQPHHKNLTLALKSSLGSYIHFLLPVTKCHKLRGLNEHPFISTVCGQKSRKAWLDSMLWVSNHWNKVAVFFPGDSGENSHSGSFKLMADSVPCSSPSSSRQQHSHQAHRVLPGPSSLTSPSAFLFCF